MRVGPSLRLQLLGLATALLSACGTPAPSAHGDLPAEFADAIILPDPIPLDAALHANGRQVGEVLMIAWEWPNQAHNDMDFWVADTDTPLPNPVSWTEGLHLAIPTSAAPISVEYSLYAPDGQPGAEAVQHGLCQHACTTSFDGGVGFPIPPVDHTGSMVVQVEWATPPTRGALPLVARVTWVIELEPLVSSENAQPRSSLH